MNLRFKSATSASKSCRVTPTPVTYNIYKYFINFMRICSKFFGTYGTGKPSVLNCIIYAQMYLNSLPLSMISEKKTFKLCLKKHFECKFSTIENSNYTFSLLPVPFCQHFFQSSVSASMKVEVQRLDKATLREDPNHPKICQLIIVNHKTSPNSSND